MTNALSIPAPKTLLLVGSSIMQGWDRPQAIAPHWQVVNRAIGGTTTSYWVQNFASVLAEVRPNAVMAYVGSNDIAQGGTADSIGYGALKIRTILWEFSPSVPFAYVAIIKAPSRVGKFDQIQAANAAVRAVLRPGDLWLESDPVFLDPGGKPIASLYVEDMLHLKPLAYQLLTASVVPALHAFLDNFKANPS